MFHWFDLFEFVGTQYIGVSAISSADLLRIGRLFFENVNFLGVQLVWIFCCDADILYSKYNLV